ncbi:MAG: tRNA (Adenine(57)-N(1)/adenine(58)-N(1))-methyltransferase TrmI [Promethearchaeota archaeon]|nr:MAG: tRNA (Adenine(57)-N(1)/adenine(58)-N(1))-methyltransferase TrmI [Candidatus Lokiarchaeota archaeon]
MKNKELVNENDLIFLVLDSKRRWLVEARPGETFHTHKGVIEFDDIIGKPFGSCVFSHPREDQGYKFLFFKPLPTDYIKHMGRKTQIIYPKDAGIILLYSGIGPGSRVIEAGCGSGALTCILGNYVRPDGYIFSFDIREKSLKTAKRNVKRAKLDKYVSIDHKNILDDDLQLENIDAIVLDMPVPWKAVEAVKKYLKLSGIIVSFSPTIEQAKKTYFALRENDFFEVGTYEFMQREFQVKKHATRPKEGYHSGYLTFGRKFQDEKNPYRGIKPKKKTFINMDNMPLRRED